MSDEDYKAGYRGHEWSPGMDRTAFEAGQAKRSTEDAIRGVGTGPKTEVDGPGIVGVVMAPILALMYPTAGLVMAATLGLVFAMTGLLPHGWVAVRVILMIVAAVLALVVALKAEHLVSRFKPYRIFRHVFRLIAVGSITFGAIIGVRPGESFERAFNHAPPSAAFAGLVAIALMHFIFPRLDRVFFPVRDGYAKSQERKYDGMSEGEVFAIKNAKFHGILRFAGVWLAGSLVLMFLLHTVSVFLLVGGWFLVCWQMRRRWFFDRARVIAKVAGRP